MCQGSRWDRLPPAICPGNNPLRPRGPDPRAASQPPTDAIHWSLETEFKTTHTQTHTYTTQMRLSRGKGHPWEALRLLSGTNVPASHLRGSLHGL